MRARFVSAIAFVPLALTTVSDAQAREKEEPFRTKEGYAQLFVSVMGGTGLRFNNPYRLATPLGADAESVSRTAGYLDIGLAGTLGNPLGVQHGFALRTTAAVEGVGQVVMSPSYFGWRRWGAWALYGRAGTALVLSPGVTWGLEASAGGAWFFLGGLGLTATRSSFQLERCSAAGGCLPSGGWIR
jgi:hypothetical protein